MACVDGLAEVTDDEAANSTPAVPSPMPWTLHAAERHAGAADEGNHADRDVCDHVGVVELEQPTHVSAGPPRDTGGSPPAGQATGPRGGAALDCEFLGVPLTRRARSSIRGPST